MQTSAAAQIHTVRTTILVMLGIEFTRSHGLEYAKSLLEILAADDETMQLFVARVVADRCQRGIVSGGKTISFLA